MDQRIVHFSLGPVQGFVAQARRTRDFWAGSFILSYLAGHAMLPILKVRGRIVLPAVSDGRGEISDPLLKAIWRQDRGEKVKNGPTLATLPNRFQAVVPADFDPRSCVQAVDRAWRALADAVWRHYVAPVAGLGNGTQEIWERQISQFWEISWAVGEAPALLERRKNWRSHVPPVEPGDKCTLMGNLQELSGYLRVKGREGQEGFWKSLRQKLKTFDLAEGERLCAVALVKRLFPLVAHEATGWGVPWHYPSTPYLAAVDWLKNVIETEPERARKYAVAAGRLLGAGHKEDPDRINCLKEALARHPEAREFASLDGNCFFAAALENEHLWEEVPGRGESTRDLRRTLRDALKKLGPPASPFYALLLMDGDRLGALLDRCKVEVISRAISKFSSQVPDKVKRYNGITVYAGGDDILALLPLSGALEAAFDLRRAYVKSFSGTGVKEGEGTISAALVYAHYNTPRTAVIREAHRLLDNVAKDKTGRDSLAVAVWKGAGRVLQWSAPWQVLRSGETNLVSELVNIFVETDPQKKEYNNSFFYNIRTRFRALMGEEGVMKDWTEAEVIDLLAAEYRRNRDREVDWETAHKRMGRLFELCRRSWREEDGRIKRAKDLVLDAVLLVKFLAEKGVGW